MKEFYLSALYALLFISMHAFADDWTVVTSPANVGKLFGEEVKHAWGYQNYVDIDGTPGTRFVDFSPRGLNKGLTGACVAFVPKCDRKSEAAKRLKYLRVTSVGATKQELDLDLDNAITGRYRPFTNNCHTNMREMCPDYKGEGLGPKLEIWQNNKAMNAAMEVADDVAIYFGDKFFDGNPVVPIIKARNAVEKVKIGGKKAFDLIPKLGLGDIACEMGDRITDGAVSETISYIIPDGIENTIQYTVETVPPLGWPGRAVDYCTDRICDVIEWYANQPWGDVFPNGQPLYW